MSGRQGPRTVGTDGTFTEFAVLQEAPAQHPTLRPHHIAIGLYSRRGDAIIRTHRVEADVDGARTVVPELAGRGQPDLILLNDDDLGYAVVRLDPRSLQTVCESIGELAGPLARAVCWSTVTDMARQAELSLAALVRVVAAGMGQESALSVLQTVLRVTRRMLSRTADPQWLPAAQEQLATAALRLLRAAEPGSDRQLAWAQLLGATAVTGEQLDVLAGLLQGSGQIPGLAVDAELRWALLGRLAATGKAADADIDAELERDATDAGRRHAAACRAAIPDAAHKAAAWRLLTESDELGVPGVVAVSEGFWQADHAQLLAPYADSYFELLPQIWASRGEQFRVLLATTLFPVTAAGPELLEQIEAFLAGDDRDPGLVRVLVESRDVVEKALRSRALPA